MLSQTVTSQSLCFPRHNWVRQHRANPSAFPDSNESIPVFSHTVTDRPQCFKGHRRINLIAFPDRTGSTSVLSQTARINECFSRQHHNNLMHFQTVPFNLWAFPDSTKFFFTFCANFMQFLSPTSGSATFLWIRNLLVDPQPPCGSGTSLLIHNLLVDPQPPCGSATSLWIRKLLGDPEPDAGGLP